LPGYGQRLPGMEEDSSGSRGPQRNVAPQKKKNLPLLHTHFVSLHRSIAVKSYLATRVLQHCTQLQVAEHGHCWVHLGTARWRHASFKNIYRVGSISIATVIADVFETDRKLWYTQCFPSYQLFSSPKQVTRSLIHLLYLLGPSSKQNVRVSVASSSKNSVANASHQRLSLSCNKQTCNLSQHTN